MKVKKYTVDKISDALFKIKNDLGGDAIILSKNKIGKRFEVVAGFSSGNLKLSEPPELPESIEIKAKEKHALPLVAPELRKLIAHILIQEMDREFTEELISFLKQRKENYSYIKYRELASAWLLAHIPRIIALQNEFKFNKPVALIANTAQELYFGQAALDYQFQDKNFTQRWLGKKNKNKLSQGYLLDSAEPNQVKDKDLIAMVPATLSNNELLKQCKIYQNLGVKCLLISNLEYCSNYSAIINATKYSDIPIGFFMTDIDNRESIELASIARICDCIFNYSGNHNLSEVFHEASK